MLLRLEDVGRSVGGRVLFRGVSLSVHRDDRIGLVGGNGVGKTTLLRIAAGDDAPDVGRVTRPRSVRVGRLGQEIDPSRAQSVRHEVASALASLDALEAEMRELEREMERCAARGNDVSADLADRYDHCRTRFELTGGFERDARIDRILAGLGIDDETASRPVASLSGGWAMRVELAKLLLAEPDVLLLDEPTNHLDLPSIDWFEATLAGYRGAVVIVSHDRTFLRRHVRRVAELELGELTVYESGYDRYVERKAERLEQLVASKRTQDREIARTERFVERFRAKNTKARQVQSRLKALARMERVQLPESRAASMRLRIPPAARAGADVLRLDAIRKSYGETVVYRGVDFLLRRGDRVALAGPNGAGKSTLLRIAAGVLPFDGGERTLGHNTELAFYAQHQLESLDRTRTVLAEIESIARLDDVPRLRGHLGAFLFSGDDVEKKVSVLSGGEKARLALAKLLLRPANLLVLDEPTNHLDVAAREVLEAALQGYTGTLLFVSHDRALINALATRVCEVRGGALADFPGNYDDYLRRREAAAPAPPGASSPAPLPGKRERVAQREAKRRRGRELARARKRVVAIEEEIARIEERLEGISHELARPEVYREGEAVRALETERDAARETLAGLYPEWEALAAAVESGEEP